MRVLVVGGSDAGIEAGLQAAARGADVELLVADGYPNFSVCGIPYYLSGEVPDWRDLAHRDQAALEAAGLTLRLETRATRIDVADRRVQAAGPRGEALEFGYDRLVVATGALPQRSPIAGLDVVDGYVAGRGIRLPCRLDGSRVRWADSGRGGPLTA